MASTSLHDYQIEVAPELKLALAGTPGGATGDVVGATVFPSTLATAKGLLTLLAGLSQLSVSLPSRRNVQSKVSTEHSELHQKVHLILLLLQSRILVVQHL